MGANESVAKQPLSDAWEVWELNNNRDDRKRDWNSPNRLLKRNSVDSSNGVLCKTRSLPELWNESLVSKIAWHRWKSIDLGYLENANDLKDGNEIAEPFAPDISLETSQKSRLVGYDSEERVDDPVKPINSMIEIKIEDLSSDLQASTQLEGIDLPIICHNSTGLSYSSLPDSPIQHPESPSRLPDSPSRVPDSPLRPRQELPNLFCDNIYQVHSDTDIFRRHLDESRIYGNRPRAWSKSTSDLSQCHLEESIDYFPCKDDSYLVTPKHGCYDWGLSIDQTGDYDRNNLTVSMKSKDGWARDDLTYSYICSENEELEGSFVCHDCGTTVPQITLNKSDNFDGRIFDQKDICSEGIDDDEFVLICSTEEKEILKEQPEFDDDAEGLPGSEYGMRSLFQEGSSYNAREHLGIFGNSKKYECKGESMSDNERKNEDLLQGSCDGQEKVRDPKEGCLRAERNDTDASCGSSSGGDVRDGGNNEDFICETMQRRFSRFSKQDTIFEADVETESDSEAVGDVVSFEPTETAVFQCCENVEAVGEQAAREAELQDQQEQNYQYKKVEIIVSCDKSTGEFQAENNCGIIDKDQETLASNPAFVLSKGEEDEEERLDERTETKHQQGCDVNSERTEKIDSCQESTEGFPLENDCEVVDKKGEQCFTDSDAVSNSRDVAKLCLLGIQDQVSGEEEALKISNEKEDSIVSGKSDLVKSKSQLKPTDFQSNVVKPDEVYRGTNESSTNYKGELLGVITPEECVAELEVLTEDVEIRYAVIVQQCCDSEANVNNSNENVSKQNDAKSADCRELSEPVKEDGESSAIIPPGIAKAVGMHERSQGLPETEGPEHVRGACKGTCATEGTPNFNEKTTEDYAKAPAVIINLTELFQNDTDGPKCPHSHTDGFVYGCLHCSYERGISDSTNDSLISADTGIEVDEMSVADIDEFSPFPDLSLPVTDLRHGAISKDMTSTHLAKRSTRELVLRNIRNGGRAESSERVVRNLMIDIDREEQRQNAENMTRERLLALAVSDGTQHSLNMPSSEVKTGDCPPGSAEREANMSTSPCCCQIRKHGPCKQTPSPNLLAIIADTENALDNGNDIVRRVDSDSENERKCTILSPVIANEDANSSNEHEGNFNTEANISSIEEQSLNTEEVNKPNIGDNSFWPMANTTQASTDNPDSFGTIVHPSVNNSSKEPNAEKITVFDQDEDNPSSNAEINDTVNIANTLECALDIDRKQEEKEDGLTENAGAGRSTEGRLQYDFKFDENNNPEVEMKLNDLKDDEDNLLNVFKGYLKNADKETIILYEDQSRVRMFVLNFEAEESSARRRACKHANDASDGNMLRSCCIEILLQEQTGRKGRTINRTKITSCFNFINDIETVKLRNCLFLKDARIVALILIRIAESSQLDSSKERFAKFVCHQVIKNALCSFDLVINWLLVFLGLIKSEKKIQIEVDFSSTLSLLQTLIKQPFFGLSHTRQLAFIISKPNISLSKHNATRVQFLSACLDLELRRTSFSCKYPFRTFVIIHSLFCYLEDNLEHAFKELDKQFVSCLNEGNCVDFVNDVLVFLGLLKSEHPVNTTTDLGTCLRLLDHVVQQTYFPASGVFLLMAFLKKPNELFESYEVERLQLLKSLQKIQDC